MLVYYFRCRGNDVKEGDVMTFVASAKNIGDVQQYISWVVRNISCERASELTDLPTVIVIDNLQHVTSLADVFTAFLLAKPANWFVLLAVYCVLKISS